MSHRISNIIQGVEFDYPTPHGSHGRGLVASDVLIKRYGCPDTPAGWLSAFKARRAELESEAAALERFTPLDSRLTMLIFETTEPTLVERTSVFATWAQNERASWEAA